MGPLLLSLLVMVSCVFTPQFHMVPVSTKKHAGCDQVKTSFSNNVFYCLIIFYLSQNETLEPTVHSSVAGPDVVRTQA